MRRYALFCAAILLPLTAAHSQNFTTAPCHDESSHTGWFFGGGGDQVCELRSTVLPLSGNDVRVLGSNGAISVIGEDRRDIALEAKVTARGSSREDAEAHLHQIHVITAGTIHAEGPGGQENDGSNWSVSYRLRVPRRVAADLRTKNGGVDVSGTEGAVNAESVNGGLSLRDLAGTVHAQTVNGGVSIAFADDRWHGDGLYAKTNNGGISVRVPNRFAAHLVASTVNGGIDVGFPINGGDGGRPQKNVDTNINGGGPTVKLETTNGGISLRAL